MMNRETLISEVRKTSNNTQKNQNETHEEKISNVAKEIIKVSDDINKKQKLLVKIEEEIKDLKKEQIVKEEEAQTLLKEHLKELKKALK
jgi:molecular chaperone GrpE (heat shock protein)